MNDYVLIEIRNGVAEVVTCSKGVTVEIHDYDVEGCEDKELTNNRIEKVVSGPVWKSK